MARALTCIAQCSSLTGSALAWFVLNILQNGQHRHCSPCTSACNCSANKEWQATQPALTLVCIPTLPGAPYPAAGGPGGSGTIPPYPSVPSAATPVPGADAYPPAHPGGSAQQQQQQQRQEWPTAAAGPQVVGPVAQQQQQQQQVEPHPISVGATFDEDDWGLADEDDWGAK